MNKDLLDLYDFFDSFFKDIFDDYCKGCGFPDCLGYIYLLPDEMEQLVDNNVAVLEINKNTYFINSFKYNQDINQFDIEEVKPKCKLRVDGKCLIYDKRPLACRMYPFGFYRDEDMSINIVIHNDCLYTKRYYENNAEVICNRITQKFESISKDFLTGIINNYKNVCYLEKFPEGDKNSVSIIMKVG